MRWLAAILALLPALSHAEELTGKVVGVSDGDTIRVLRGGAEVTIRLHGVDCPEKNQPYGMKAKQLTSKLVFGKHVKVVVKDKDRYGRVVGVVFVKTGETIDHYDDGRSELAKFYECLNDELVKAGLAWWYQQYAPKHPTFGKYEADARKARRGLWAEANPTAPWEYRRMGEAEGKVADAPGPGKGDRPAGNAYRGNVRSKVGVPSPAEPPSRDRACRSDGDCVFAPRGGCGCSPCGATWHRAVNKTHADWLQRQYAIESCPRIACAPCPTPVRWLGTKAVCISGQCEVR